METLYTVYRKKDDELLCFEQPGRIAYKLLRYTDLNSFRSAMCRYRNGQLKKYAVNIVKVEKGEDTYEMD